MQIEIRGVERLSFRERQVVALKETGHSNQAIARRLSVSLATVATLFSRAKAKGYQVVLVLDGDPLNLYPDTDDDAHRGRDEEGADVEHAGTDGNGNAGGDAPEEGVVEDV